ncbi:MAG: Na+/H+ antiporter NhaC family protein [Verrucomicrobiota bacterium]
MNNEMWLVTCAKNKKTRVKINYFVIPAAVFLLVISLVLGLLNHSWFCLWPPLMGLILIILTRDVVVSLWLAAFGAALVYLQGNWLAAPGFFLDNLLLPSLTNAWNLQVIIFTLLMGGFVALIEYGRGLENFINSFLRRFEDKKRGVEFGSVGLGFLCFFDGLANAMFVGRLVKPLADNCRISPAKMAYIVDTTSSPLACLAFVSTWIAYQLSMIRAGYEQAGLEVNAYEVFLASIPSNFYCWASLILLLGVVTLRFWPFKEASYSLGNQAQNSKTVSATKKREKGQGKLKTGGVVGVFIPVVFLWISILGGLYYSGASETGSLQPVSLAEALGKAETAKVLVLSAFFATALAWVLNGGWTDPLTTSYALKRGMLSLLRPVFILLGAWCLSEGLKALGAAELLSQLIGAKVPFWLYPSLVFLGSSLIAFLTGTSWGTMGLVMPLALSVVLGAPLQYGEDFSATIVAAVFSGAVFGDHCSPLSDTTIVSAMATGSETLEHVRTQLPFALIAAGFSLLLGFIPSGLGLGSWCFWGCIAAVLVTVCAKTYFFTQKANSEAS